MTRKNLRTIRNGLVSGFAAYLGAQALFAVAVTALYYLLVPFAHAQTYVRPSRGAPITISNAVAPGGSVISPLFDFSAFSEAQVTVQSFVTGTQTPANLVDCSNRFGFNLSSGPTKDGTLGTSPQSVVTDCTWGNIPLLLSVYTATIADFAQYTKATVNVGAVGTYVTSCRPGGYVPSVACDYRVILTPIPFASNVVSRGERQAGTFIGSQITPIAPVMAGVVDQWGLVTALRGRSYGNTNRGAPSGLLTLAYDRNNASTGNIKSVTGTQASVFQITSSGFQSGARLQNVGTNPIVCDSYFGGVLTYTLSATRYGFVLEAGAANDDGKGGVIELSGMIQDQSVVCATLTGTSRLAVISQ